MGCFDLIRDVHRVALHSQFILLLQVEIFFLVWDPSVKDPCCKRKKYGCTTIVSTVAHGLVQEY